MDAVLLDTCVLLKSYLCDTLLSIAEEGACRPLWPDHVLAELRRNLVKAGAKHKAVEHRGAAACRADSVFASWIFVGYGMDIVGPMLMRGRSRARAAARPRCRALCVLGAPAQLVLDG